jgi:hypothetical protein
MKITYTFSFFFFFLSFSERANCQKDSLLNLIETKSKAKPTFVITTDFRETLVQSTAVLVYGGIMGLRFKDVDFYSLGYYSMTNTSASKFKLRNRDKPILVNHDVSLWFVSAGYNRTVYDSKIFKIDIPLEIGFGKSSDGIYNMDEKLLDTKNSNIFPLQGGVSATVKLTRWFGIRLQGGYREMFGSSFLKRDYSGLYYAYGLSFDFETIFKDLKRKKSSVAKQKNAVVMY